MTARIALFDLGNVVVDWNPTRLYAKLMNDATAAARFCETVCTLEWHTAHDRGVLMADNAKTLIEQHPDKEDLILAWNTHWMDMFTGYVAGVPSILEALKEKQRPLYALTNFPGEKWRDTADVYPLLEDFIDVIISSEEKCVKPDPRIYEIALERMGSPDPATVFFTDDRLPNIEAARAFGMQAHQFTTADNLKSALQGVGLL